jgi:hypothetical protein
MEARLVDMQWLTALGAKRADLKQLFVGKFKLPLYTKCPLASSPQLRASYPYNDCRGMHNSQYEPRGAIQQHNQAPRLKCVAHDNIAQNNGKRKHETICTLFFAAGALFLLLPHNHVPARLIPFSI